MFFSIIKGFLVVLVVDVIIMFLVVGKQMEKVLLTALIRNLGSNITQIVK